MIRVTVEMWPGGSKARKRTLGGMDICNVGGTARLGTYEVHKLDKNLKRCGGAGHVRGHRRLDVSFWWLVAKALVEILPKRQTKEN